MHDPADTSDSPVYFCKMSAVKIIFVDICTGQHLTSDNCPVKYFFDRDFCTKHNENVQCSSFISPHGYFTKIKIHRTYFCSEALCPVWKNINRSSWPIIFWHQTSTPDIHTGHPHQTVRCIGRVRKHAKLPAKICVHIHSQTQPILSFWVALSDAW